MNFDFNILWLDDDPIDLLPIIRDHYPDLCIQKVDYMDQCSAIIDEKADKLQAVILDANGKSLEHPELPAAIRGFMTLVHKVIEKKIPLYIFSGQFDRDKNYVTLEALEGLGLKENEQIFYKSDSAIPLIEKVKADIDNLYKYYIGHEYLLDFFTKGWLSTNLKEEYLDPIMKSYKENDLDSAHGNHMRNIVEQILLKVNETYGVCPKMNPGDPGWAKMIANAIKESYIDYTKLIAGPLFYMIEIMNGRSHVALDQEERQLYFQSDFSAFFVVTHWFYKVMTSYDLRMQKASYRPDPVPTIKVATYKEQDIRYCDIKKIRVPDYLQHADVIKVACIIPDKNHKGEWFLKCR